VPLTRFTEFLQHALRDLDERGERDVIFVCRSGNRSSRAAQVLRRLGVKSAWHVAGGIALGASPGRSRPHAAAPKRG
jgi:rhodanese-related sulfurtransferase